MAAHCGVGLGALGEVAGPLWVGVGWEAWCSDFCGSAEGE